MPRFSHWDFDAVRAANRKQALVPEGAYVIDPVGTAPGRGGAREADGRGAAGPAARAPADVARRRWRASRCRRPSPGAPSTGRRWCGCSGCPESGLAETLRDAEESIDGFDGLEITTCLRRGEIEMVTRFEPGAARGVRRRSSSSIARAARRARSSRRTARAIDDQVAAAARGPADRDGGVVHRRPAGGAAHRAAGLVRVRGGRRGGLLERGEGGAARRGPGADRGARRGVRAVADGDGRGRAAPLRARTPRWRSRASRGPAAGPRRSRSGRCAGASGRATAAAITRTIRLPGRPSRHPRPLDDRGDAPAAPRAVGGPGRGARSGGTQEHVSGPRARMFLALDLPERRAATSSSGGATRSWRSRTDVRPVRPEALHVTLVFLGWQDESAAERIADGRVRRAAGAGRRRALAADRGASRSRRATRACSRSTSTTRAAAPTALQAAMSDALEAGGWYRPEKRPFWPHITLARVKRGERRVPPPPAEPAPPAEPVRGERAHALPLDAAAAGRALRAACAYGCGRCARSRFPTRR